MTNFPHEDQEVLARQNINTLYTPMVGKIGVYDLVFDAYGLGYYLENLPNGEWAVSHGGQGGGVMTHFHSFPETGDGIVILTNSQRSWPFIAFKIIYLLPQCFPSFQDGWACLSFFWLWFSSFRRCFRCGRKVNKQMTPWKDSNGLGWPALWI